MSHTSSRVRWLLASAGGILLLCCVLVLLFLFTSCSFNKYIVAAGLPKPDRAFQTGTVAGYDVFIWDCYQGKRIVLYHESSEMRSGPFVRQEVACGQMAPIEQTLASTPRHDLNPDNFW